MNNQYHFVGIGGIGMGALASILLDKGCSVSGSDVRMNQVTQRLIAKGANIFVGHKPENIKGATCVVFSSAIDENNPELIEAGQMGIPVIRRAKLLAELMEGQIGITVAGAHGKTTTTSMVAHVLTEIGLQPTTAIGGIVNQTHSHAGAGGGKYFVTEVDESDGSFLFFSPHFSIITNIDLEHVDYYHDWSSLLDVYRIFIDRTSDEGMLFGCGDDERLFNLLHASGKPFKTYGCAASNDLYAVNITFDHFKSRFECMTAGGDLLGTVHLNVPGRHNVLNALGCISLGLQLSIPFNAVADSLNKYSGVQRRFQLKDKINDIWVIDDYAHHPTEITATLDTAVQFKQSLKGESNDSSSAQLISVFQPHRYSRVKGFMDAFAESLTNSDYLIVTDIYPASEQPIEGITAEKLCDQIKAKTSKPVVYLPKEKIVSYLLTVVRPGDVVLTLGAGDITKFSEEFITVLRERQVISTKASQ